jgi:LPS export ABC transporter protein LptC
MPLILLIILSLALNSCVNDLETIQEVAKEAEPIVEEGEGVRILYSEDGNVRLMLEAPRVLRIHDEKDPRVEFPEGLKVYFYDDSLKITTKLRADYGIRYENKGETEVRDRVIVINKKGERLSTEELIWKEEDRKIISNSFVKITTAREVLFGTGMEADEQFSHYTITKPEGTLNVTLDDEVDEDF